MYFDFYQLRKAPFSLTPDPEFLFLSPSHQQAFGAILYGILERKGLVVVTGEVGLGKTTLLRAALKQVETKQLTVISTLQANIAFAKLLELLSRELHVCFSPDDPDETVLRLRKALAEKEAQGATVVLIVDEAQDLPLATLRQLRLFLNLETDTAKLLQVVLVGQPELKQKLALPELRALTQCVAVQETLSPMSMEESVAYIEHRLAKVALEQESIFSPAALQHIAACAHGAPRVLNVFCDNVLIAGFADQERPISAALAREVIAELEGNPLKKSFAAKEKRGAAIVGTLGALTILLAGLLYWQLPSLRSWFEVKKSLTSPLGGRVMESREKKFSAIPSSPPVTFAEQPEQPLTPPHVEAVDAPSPQSPITPAVAVASTPSTPQDLQSAGEQGAAKTLTMKTTAPRNAQPSKAAADTPAQTFPVARVVKRGDSLSKMIASVYGRSSTERVQWVKAHNPDILDENNLEVGQTITFPALEESAANR